MSFPQVVRVYATTQEPDYDCPWQSQRPVSATGSGVIIGPQQVLTGAHVVANATFLQLQHASNPNKVLAKVKAICHDSDLALLEIEDPTFTEGISPAPIGELPLLRERVSVVGFPIGGEQISITEGVVSRIEVQRYSHSQRHLLAVTVDAAINDGNSGGPVFQNQQIAGIAFQKINQADNIGEMVPAPLIRHFLQAIEEGKPTQMPGLSITTQNLENPVLRQELQMTEKQSGVMVTHINYGGSAWGVLQPRDVLLRIGDLPIANNGTILYKDMFRTRYDVALTDYHIGDTLPFEILRAGKTESITLTLQALKHLVARSQYDRSPTYFIFAGLVFQPLTKNFISTWNRWREAPIEYQYLYAYGNCTPEQQEVITLTQVLNDALNVGYEDFDESVVLSVNGHKPKHMADFVAELERSESTARIRLSGGSELVLDVAQARQATEQLLEHYNIPRDRSLDLT